MLHNSKITHLIASIDGKLLPVAGKEANPGLWRIYDQLQEWRCAVEWEQRGIVKNQSASIAESIFRNLVTLPDRRLAQEIKRIVRQNNYH